MNSPSSKKVKIIYGWAEGPWHGKRLRAELKKSGYTVTRSIKHADILIAHSGGCFLLPESGNANLILLIGLPYWPKKSPLRSMREKVKDELRDLYWYKKTVCNGYYFLSRPKKLLKVSYKWKKQLFPNHETAEIIAIRNQKDSFAHPTDTNALAQERGWKLQLFDGGHDDIWKNPKPYVRLLNDSYKLLD